MPGMIPYKRVAVADGKSPIPMYQQPVNIAAYQQAIAAMQGQQYFPMTCKFYIYVILSVCYLIGKKYPILETKESWKICSSGLPFISQISDALRY